MKIHWTLALSFITKQTLSFSVAPPPAAVNRITSKKPPCGGRAATTQLRGLLDEIQGDEYNLMDTSSTEDATASEYEIYLGDLVFSTNDPRLDVMNNYDRYADDQFLDWMKKKGEASKDPEERLALKDLYEMIVDVKKRIKLSKMAEDRKAEEAASQEKDRITAAEEEAKRGSEMSNTDVLRKAAAITSVDAGVEDDEDTKKLSFFDQELTPEIRMSYDDILEKLLPPYEPTESARTVVSSNYDQFDAQLVKVLSERAENGDADSSVLLAALAEEQKERIAEATDKLKSVLSLGDPMQMEGAIVRLAREGSIDESFLLLLEANETQARDAGAIGPADLMKKLRNRAAMEKDKNASSKEIRLIRQLLRAEDAPEREKILEDAFTPRENLLVKGTPENAAKAMDGEQPEQEKPMPDVLPPDFINACKAVMLNFGNIEYDDERGDLASRIKQIAAEAEVVATRIYGQGMSVRDQQDKAWKDETTSIFDLEHMELDAESRGEHAPWTNPDAEDGTFLPGFNADGKMRIGGES